MQFIEKHEKPVLSRNIHRIWTPRFTLPALGNTVVIEMTGVVCADTVVSVASSHVGRSHEVWIPYTDSLRECQSHAVFRHH